MFYEERASYASNSLPSQAAAATAGQWGALLQRKEQEWAERLATEEAEGRRRVARLQVRLRRESCDAAL